jgi:hypothetical protein
VRGKKNYVFTGKKPAGGGVGCAVRLAAGGINHKYVQTRTYPYPIFKYIDGLMLRKNLCPIIQTGRPREKPSGAEK